MKGTLVIAARELRESTRVFAICAILATLPFLATLLPGAQGNREDVIAAVGGFLSIAVGLGLAVVLGATTIGRELTERRMSFYFAKPVSPAAIWFGKATAALAISLGCFALIVVPAYVGAPDAWRVQQLGGIEPLAIAALIIVELFLVSHFLSSILRSRSSLLAVDLVCFSAALAALFLIIRPVLFGGSMEVTGGILVSVGIAASVILAIAPAWQLAQGRTDLRRGHAALSRFLWISVGLVLLIVGAYVAWLVAIGPADLQEVMQVEHAGRGESVLVSGRGVGRGGHASTFLINRRTSAYERLPVLQWWGSRFSDDGQVLIWQKPSGLFNVTRLEVHATRLRDGKSFATGITMHPYASAMLPSPDGSRLAIVENRKVVVYETATGKLLAAGGRFDSGARHALFFAAPDVVRITEYNASVSAIVLRVFELDTRARAIRKTGEARFETAGRGSVSLSGDGTRMLVRGANRILDARTAKVIAQIHVGVNPMRSAMLQDGSVAAMVPGEPRLRIFSREGQPLQDVVLPGVKTAMVTAEVEGGKVILVGSNQGRADATGQGRRMFVVDARRGAVERAVVDVKGPMPDWPSARLLHFAAGQQLAAVDARGKLVTWDPRTGAVRKM